MAWVLHDWPDAEAYKILQNLVPSMKPGSRLILSEYIKRPAFSESLRVTNYTNALDLQMMTMAKSREWSQEGWEALITKGSEGKLKVEWTKQMLLCFQKV